MFIGYYNCGPGSSPMYNVGWVIFERSGILYGSYYYIINNSTSEMLDETNDVFSGGNPYVVESTSYGFNAAPIWETAELASINPIVNITSVDFDSNILQMHLTESEMCRWLDDGMDSEYLYCDPDPSMTFCRSIHQTLHTYSFISK